VLIGRERHQHDTILNGIQHSGPNEESVLADFVSVDLAARAPDGYRATVRFRILESLKGTLKAGEIVQVRFASGDSEDGDYQQVNYEPLLLPGFPESVQSKPWVLHLSKRHYENVACHQRGLCEHDAGHQYFASTSLFAVREGRLRTLGHDSSPGTLAAYRTAARDMQARFIKAGIYPADAK
jgi:hypothetical protein